MLQDTNTVKEYQYMYWNLEYGIHLKKTFAEFCNLSYFFRHGAHNWEGPGALTAISALFALTKHVQEHSWVAKKIDPNRVVYAGIQQYPI